MFKAKGNGSTWIDRAVPEAVGSPAAQGLNAFAGIIGLVFVLHSNDPTFSALSNILFAIGIQSIAIVIIATACARKPANSAIRASGIVIAGGVRGSLVLIILIQGTNGLSIGQGIFQILGSIVFTALWLLAAGHVVQGTRDYRATFAARFEQAVAAGTQNTQNSASWMQARNLAATESTFAQSKLADTIISPGKTFDQELARNMITIAGEIHAAALDRIRPASHKMWDHGSHRPPSLRVRTVFRRAFRVWQPPIPVAVTIAAVVTGFGAMLSSDLRVGLFTAAIVAAVAFALLYSRKWIQLRSKRSEAASTLLLVAIAPATFVVLEFAGRAIGLPSDIPGVFVVSLACFTLCFVVIALSGISQHRRALIAEMDYLLNNGFWQVQVSKSVESRHATDAATFLHHKVQSQLLAVALQLEMAVQSNDQSQLIESIDKARTILTDSVIDVHATKNLYDSILQLPAEWEGICAISLRLPPESDLPPNTWSLIDMVVRELVANAVRSGRANQVQVDLAPDSTNNLSSPTHLVLNVHDNGIGYSPASPGLGTTWVNVVAGNVQVTESPIGGASITLLIPVAN